MLNLRAMGQLAAGLAVAGAVGILPAQSQGLLGITRNALDGSHAALCSVETAFGNVIANAMKEQAGADVALINCAAIKSDKTFAAGSELTEAEMTAALPTGKLVLVDLTGEQLLSLLENGFSTIGKDDGRFPQVSGLRLDVDPGKPAGQRIVKVTVNGKALEFARTYRVATTDTLLSGAHGYSAFADGKVLVNVDAGQPLASAIAAHVRKEGVVDVKAWGRIEFLK